MLIKQISVFVENKPGRLAFITKVLADAGIDISAMSISDTTDFGILRLIVNKPDEAKAALTEAGLTLSVTKVIGVGITDEPGGLAKALAVLADASISVEYLYAFVGRKEGMAYVILRVEDNDRAVEVLQKAGLYIVTCDEVYQM